jgi:hypothetical protein
MYYLSGFLPNHIKNGYAHVYRSCQRSRRSSLCPQLKCTDRRNSRTSKSGRAEERNRYCFHLPITEPAGSEDSVWSLNSSLSTKASLGSSLRRGNVFKKLTNCRLKCHTYMHTTHALSPKVAEGSSDIRLLKNDS